MVLITEKPLNPEEIVSGLKKDTYGAVATFLGIVRGYARGKKLLYMEYDAYREMAEKKLQEIVEEIKTKWKLEDVAICHRIGRLEIGETSLVVAIASPHRKEAFQACQYAVDRIKHTVPIWKKEVDVDGGGHWVEGYLPEPEE